MKSINNYLPHVGRIPLWDVAKFFGMFIVIYGHLIVDFDHDGYNCPINVWIYSFHMSLFFIISGYFFFSSLKRDIKTLVKSKFMQLLIPYCVWSVIEFVLSTLIKQPISQYPETILHYIVTLGPIRGLWYLKNLFIYYIVVYVSIKLIKNDMVAAVITSVVFFFMPCWGFLPCFITMFWVGYFLRKYKSVLEWKYSIFVFGFLSLSFLLWSPSYSYVSCNMDFVSHVMRIVVGCSMSIFIILLIKWILSLFDNDSSGIGHLCRLGEVSLGVYCCHIFVFVRPYDSFLKTIVPDNHLILFLLSILLYYLSYLFIIVTRRNKILDKALYGNYKIKK